MQQELPTGLLVLLVVLLITVPMTVLADSTNSYTSTASLFTIGTGARPLGMANAFVGLADGTSAVFYNPAGLVFLEQSGLTSFYSNQYSSFHYGSVDYAGPNLGLSYRQLSSGTLTERDLYGNSTGEFSYTSRGLIGTCGMRLEDLGLALQGKVFTRANPGSVLGYSLSPSFLYRIEPFQVGGIFKNLLSTDITYSEDHSEPWQEEITLGVAYSTEKLNLVLDVDALLDERGIDPEVARIGAEGKVFSHTLVRMGVTSKLQSSIGLGVRVKGWQADYSFQFHEELPSTHRLSLTARFGQTLDGAWKEIQGGLMTFFSEFGEV